MNELSPFDAITDDLKITATYNLSFNTIPFVQNGVGYTVTLENVQKNGMKFLPFIPKISVGLYVAAKKYQAHKSEVRRFLEMIEKDYSDVI